MMRKRQLWTSGHRNNKPDKWIEDSSDVLAKDGIIKRSDNCPGKVEDNNNEHD